MREQLLANISVDLKFFRRNRLLLAMAVVFIAITLIYITASLLMESSAGKFDVVRSVFSQLSQFISIFTAGLGLFLVSSQVRGKSIKLVLTKPCKPEVWLSSAFLSAIGVALLLHLLAFVIAIALSLIWHLPIQPGFAFFTVILFVQSTIVLSYLILLTMAFHPVLAVLIALVFTESTFYALRDATLTAIKATGGNVFLPAIEKLSFVIYMALPITSPFEDRYQAVSQSFRVSHAQWITAVYALGYAATISLLCYFGSLRLLQRKALM